MKYCITIILYLCALSVLADSAYMMEDRLMTYIDNNGGDIFQVDTVTYDMDNQNKITFNKWGVTGVAKATYATLPSIQATTNWVATVYSVKLKEKYAPIEDWEALISSLRETIRIKWNWSTNEMATAISTNMNVKKLKKEKKNK